MISTSEPMEPMGSAGASDPVPHDEATSPNLPARRLANVERGMVRLNQAREALALRQSGLTLKQIADRLGTNISLVNRLLTKAAAVEGPMQAADFAPRMPGPRQAQPLLPTEVAEVKALVLQTNRNWRAGSAPEAIWQAAKRGALRPDLVETFHARAAAGKPLLTEPMRRQLRVGEAAVHAYRHPRDAWLTYVNSPGSLMLTIDQQSGEERYVDPGEAWTIDDGTINVVCCVPTGDPKWKFGVMPGRFQFLLTVDHRSYCILGFSYTARPRQSYRAEDLLATLHLAFLEHGLPKRLILEKGISAAGSITRMCDLAGIAIDRAASPHQKMVELVFDKLWTKLSLLPGQVGRYRGEEEKVTALIESCRSGAKDPRKHFLLLSDFLAALRTVIAEWNDHRVDSRYGEWRPREFWAERAPRHLRPLNAEDGWMFAPHVTQPLKVRGAQIATSVSLAPDVSQVFTFDVGFALNFIGASVQIQFNPFAPSSVGKVLLVEDFAGIHAGTVLGDARMIDRQARHTRRIWGYSAEEDIGREAARRNSQELHRTVVAIRPDGKPGIANVEVRDGLGNATAIDINPSAPATPIQAPTGDDELAGPPRVGQRGGSGAWSIRAKEAVESRAALDQRRVPDAPTVDDADLVALDNF